MIRSLGSATAMVLAAGGALSIVQAQTVVIPNANTSVAGTAGLNTVIRDAPNTRTAQLLIDSSELTFVPPGSQITGIEFRLYNGALAPYPTANATWASYDIYCGQSVTPSAGTTTFASNVVGTLTQVRSGPLTIPAGSFPSGSNPNQFGPTITFTTPYTYNGGHLLVEIRHTGSDVPLVAANSHFADAVGATATLNRSFTATSNVAIVGAAASFTISRLIFGPPAVSGRCCLGAPTYACVVTSQTACQSQGGTYGGDGTTCSPNPCPPAPTGACCLTFGGCSVITQLACINGGGTYAGDNVTCAAANCPPSGRCCFSNGSCLVLTSAQCTTAGGTYGGNNTVCSTGACTQQPGNIACNGPFVTSPNGACIPTGEFHSEVQPGNTIAGFNQNGALVPPFRIADDFTVPAGETWTINGFTFYGYQTGASVPVSSFTGATCQIWNGRPGDVGSTVVAGDATTNVLTSSTFTNTYRTFNAACDLTRPIFANTVTLGSPAVLTPGTYWVDFNATGSLASGPWALNVTVKGLGSPPNANGRQLTQTPAWQDLLDGARVQDAAFCVRGTVASGGCYANCDGSTGSPLLTANDFQCFLNKFAAGDTYANCDGSTGNPLLTANDFQCFLNKYATGCT